MIQVEGYNFDDGYEYLSVDLEALKSDMLKSAYDFVDSHSHVHNSIIDSDDKKNIDSIRHRIESIDEEKKIILFKILESMLDYNIGDLCTFNSYLKNGSKNSLADISKFTNHISDLIKKQESLKKQYDEAMDDYYKIRNELRSLNDDFVNCEKEKNHWKKQSESKGRFKLDNFIPILIDALSDIYNSAMDDEGSDNSKILNYVSMISAALKVNGIELTNVERGSKYNNEPVGYSKPKKTGDPELNNIVYRCNRFGYNAKDVLKSDALPDITVYEYDPSVAKVETTHAGKLLSKFPFLKR